PRTRSRRDRTQGQRTTPQDPRMALALLETNHLKQQVEAAPTKSATSQLWRGHLRIAMGRVANWDARWGLSGNGGVHHFCRICPRVAPNSTAAIRPGGSYVNLKASVAS